MDDQRAQTLQALEAFIQTQKNLLVRQRSDIERLKKLRVDFVQTPAEIISNLSNELDDSAFRISEQADCRLSLPKNIEWSTFEKSDTGPLRTFAQKTRDGITHRRQPSLCQSSELSDLQRFVKQARRSIVDPILARFADMSSPEPESDEEVDPIELKRREEHEKIRELKKRQIRSCGLSLPLSNISGTMGVIIRSEVDDEAMDVDVSIDDNDDKIPDGNMPPIHEMMDVDVPDDVPIPSSTTASPVKVKPPKASSSSRPRRAPKKTANDMLNGEDDDLFAYVPVPDKGRPRKKVNLKVAAPSSKSAPVSDEESADEEEAKPATTKKARGSAKPKPETYKQAWSESEQNLLEQLLEQIPDGEKFRWQKISKAMGGRRTPRQVASRVQKYFEKLKRFGIGVDS
ncbi:hypothetical protein CPC08DRAFT_711462 [Agrocybe pediades]|nr:hypothetical protein CPC08DRAFT_711462 [Agrocybe pediades]